GRDLGRGGRYGDDRRHHLRRRDGARRRHVRHRRDMGLSSKGSPRSRRRPPRLGGLRRAGACTRPAHVPAGNGMTRDERTSNAGRSAPKIPSKDTLRAALPKRFYKSVTVEPRDGGFAVLLDGRTIRTPAKRTLV